ncbi:TPA: DUF4034 domain-containing protein [Stenotrophomonas maltophilia]|uniref:DUF4034 domain-containing protein n=2 Tax=Stenotrophomonas maltophilia TaxID=40324 RepID=B2FN46_STRMK|nr:DUF4034 domain-containing protein [Stenotrophomonas maltophilia]CAQ46773.1 conserved hypothetical protein [Stenotrophomonas maltophilia K279a]MBY8925427.1 DUF4034 domain-containing protein [Stenotrophomonas maltophilia]MCU1208835.1 DUF4034 domain-containing protein [Stenotrophomonas maltophilia]PJL17403.1 hypothetical protein B9Y71_12610 [Stenotrophomonas maltophilia]
MTNGLVKDGLSMDDLAWRAQARTALQEHDHAALESLLAPHEQAWLNGTRPLPGIRWRLRNLQDTALPLDERLQQAQRWVAAAPHSYYAHLRLGACWESAAGALRSADVAALVEDSQWLAAQQARDHAVHAYLQAITLSQRPALALDGIKRITSYLREPNWLRALQAGQSPESDEAALAEHYPQAWPQALQLLSRFGAPLQHLPECLPPLLRDRSEDDFDAPLAYWMRLVLEQRPDDLGTLEDTLYYLYPRWGGSHEAMEDFIEGGWCRGLELAQRNALRWCKEQDWMGDLPRRGDAEAVAVHERAYAQILDWHLEGYVRAEVLTQRAAFRFHLGRIEEIEDQVQWDAGCMQAVLEDLQQAWVLDRDMVLHGGFSSLEACTWFAHVDGAEALFAQVVDYAAREGDSALGLLWAATAIEHGLLGQEADPARAQPLLQRALKLAVQQKTSTVTFASNLFCDVSQAAGLSLLQRMADDGDAGAMAALCDLYKGRMGGRDQPDFVDAQKALYWQERAVEGGDLIATYNLAVRQVAAGGADNEARARELYLRCLREADAGERVWGPACRNLACLAFDGQNDAHKREAVERALIPLWWRGEDDEKLWAAGYLADVYHFGNGVPANAFLALTWLQRASEIDPEYVDVVRMTPLINGEGRWFGASRARKQQEQDRQQVDSATWALTFGQRSQDSNLTAV